MSKDSWKQFKITTSRVTAHIKTITLHVVMQGKQKKSESSKKKTCLHFKK